MPISYRFIEPNQFFAFFRKHRRTVFADDFDFNIEKVLSEQEKAQLHDNQLALQQAHRYFLVAIEDGQMIGWSMGVQKSAEDYYIINSAVLPGYRRKGIYTQMMQEAVQLISQLGYQRIYSRHKMTNNAILIPKLQFGFVITGFELNDLYGNLVELSYYTNATRRKLLNIRAGTQKPDVDSLKLIQNDV